MEVKIRNFGRASVGGFNAVDWRGEGYGEEIVLDRRRLLEVIMAANIYR